MKLLHALPATWLALAAIGVHAQTQAPGLWEHSFRLTPEGGEMAKAMAEMQAQLAAMPPEKRAQLEAMMKGRGVTLGAPVSGEGQVSDASDKACTGTSTMTTQVKGQPQQVGMAMTGQWLGADCGDVKPLAALPAK